MRADTARMLTAEDLKTTCSRYGAICCKTPSCEPCACSLLSAIDGCEYHRNRSRPVVACSRPESFPRWLVWHMHALEWLRCDQGQTMAGWLC